MNWLVGLCVLLSGCACTVKGLDMDAEERHSCEIESCTVWTQKELNVLFKEAIKRGMESGYEAGYAAGVKSL